MKIKETTKHNLYALACFVLTLVASSVDSVLLGLGL